MNTDNQVISYYAIRRLIGILGIALPFLCWTVNAVVNDFDLLNDALLVNTSQSSAYHPDGNLKSSISHFYYTTAGPLFTGVLITVAIFLFCYKGYPLSKKNDRFYWLTDNRLATFAALCALGIVIFPTDSANPVKDNIHIYVASNTVGTLHLVFAALFFLSMAVFSIINFRRKPGKILITDARGKLFLYCGWGMIACLVLLATYSFIPGNPLKLPYYFVYLMEAIMLLLFGTAWLVKGRSIPTEYILEKIEGS